jgi:hypothetical protein
VDDEGPPQLQHGGSSFGPAGAATAPMAYNIVVGASRESLPTCSTLLDELTNTHAMCLYYSGGTQRCAGHVVA